MKRLFKIRYRIFKKKKSSEQISNGKGLTKKKFIRRYALDIAVLFLCAFLLTAFFPKGKSYQFSDLKEGRVYVGSEIIAPFTFPVNKSPEEYNADVKKARESVTPVFQRNKSIEKAQKQKLKLFLDQLRELLRVSVPNRENIQKLFRDEGIIVSDEDILLLMTGFEDQNKNVGEAQYRGLLDKRIAAFEAIDKIIKTSVDDFYSTGILDLNKRDFSPNLTKITVRESEEDSSKDIIQDLDAPYLEDLNYYFDRNEALNYLLENLRTNYALDEKRIKITYQITAHYLAPNILYDKQNTEDMIQVAIANVPLAKDQVLAGERIIDSHERISRQHIEKLNSLALAKAEMGETSGFWSRIAPYIGKFFIVLFILGILSIYIWRDHRYIVNDRKKSSLILLVIILLAILTFLLNSFSLSVFLVPVTIAAIIITIFFNTQIGFLVTIAISLLVGSMRGNDFVITFISIFVSSIAILTVSKVRTRNWILRSFAAIGVAYIISIIMLDFVNYIPVYNMIQDLGFGLINAFLSPIFAYGLVIIFEFAFDMTTDMTLLELSDLNQPLLRQLAIQAPGTYHHSILVGTLAEAATESIGGNPLLARVGAYYHDIGKMEKPEYFVENQTKGRNPQEKLSPTMSSLILSNHVKKGIEMARQYNLPREIEDFIHQHHGTTLMSYFYQKALEKSSEEQISKDEFRYPGPKPNSRETAIVMCADAVEAASRTLKDPSPSRIKGLVEQIIDERFKSNELDDSPLTLKDLSKISEAFLKILNGVFHSRIEYPSEQKKETAIKEVKVNK
ncbi:HDIG domain-containing protein [candidate division KSB1 bacterium]|nr:HDIG domain-containing protein [candidate division KSB1 bacterium]